MSDVDTPSASARPWYLGALLGVSAWFAGILLLLGMALVFTPKSAAAAAALGALLLGAAFGLLLADRHSGFLAQLGLCISIAGQCLLIFGLSGKASSALSLALTALLVQSALAALMPNRMHRSLSTLFALIAWAIWLRLLEGQGNWSDFWGSSATQAKLGASDLLWEVGLWLCTWLIPGAALWWLLRKMASIGVNRWQQIGLPIARGLIVGIASATALTYAPGLIGSSNASFAGLWPLLSALAAAFMVAAGFRLHSAALIGFTTLCAFIHLSWFYYDLGLSLLMKSIVMMAIGALCLGARALVQTRWRLA